MKFKLSNALQFATIFRRDGFVFFNKENMQLVDLKIDTKNKLMELITPGTPICHFNTEELKHAEYIVDGAEITINVNLGEGVLRSMTIIGFRPANIGYVPDEAEIMLTVFSECIATNFPSLAGIMSVMRRDGIDLD